MNRLETDNANISLKFNIVFPQLTLISNRETFLNSEIILSGDVNNIIINKSVSLTLTGAMLCPNSKAKSDFAKLFLI